MNGHIDSYPESWNSGWFFRDHPTQGQEPQLYFHYIVGEQKEVLYSHRNYSDRKYYCQQVQAGAWENWMPCALLVGI